MDKRDFFFFVGISLLSLGMYFVYPPLAAISSGAIFIRVSTK